MVDMEIVKKLQELRDKEPHEPEDALTLFECYKPLVEEIEDVQEELEDLDEIKVLNTYTDSDFQYWVKVGEGKFEVGEGSIDDPDITMSADNETWAGLGSGELDSTSAYMSGDLEIEGNLQSAMAYGEILELIREYLEELESNLE
ncbi:MAG: SCP2 sterol-binding domain-containing protein [Promethearchaeota archaeon]|nr:MAG: SCP2 sterol-binding domain-containing protein [Candidatus Lokiarchaeota archaeon]